MSEQPPPGQNLSPQPPADPGPAPPAAPPWTPGQPGPPTLQNPEGWTLPPVSDGYAAAPLPLRRRDRRRRGLLSVMAVLMAVLVLSGLAVAITSHHSRFSIITSSSTDGTFNAGDCIALSATRVTQASCTGAHDAQIVQVIHAKHACPSGTEEFDVTDGTGNLCLDKSNNAKG